MTENAHRVRVAAPQDAEGVSAVLEQSYPILMKSSYDDSVLASALKYMTKANPTLLGSGSYFVAESEEGCVVGCGGWTVARPGDGKVQSQVGHVRHFGTHPNWTRRGIGKAIYRACEVSARAAGITRLECYSSLNAEMFYSALGFDRLRRIDIEIGDRVSFPGILMRRAI